MDVFSIRNHMVADYGDYVTSFVSIREAGIREKVDAALEAGLLWPEPRVGINPAFESGGTVDDLVDEGVLHPECRRIFRIRTDSGEERPLHLHRHQDQAIRAAHAGDSYLLTSGTGSGKSLTYIIPIVDMVLREGPGNGVKAIVVYPMNALANSQMGELEKFLGRAYAPDASPVRFARYTGQEDDEEREAIISNPPDVILTNYVMLELLLTRVTEEKLIAAARGLRFLVLDELHTYRGRQGADVALLVRRTRDACEATNLQCVGTSATLAGQGSVAEVRQELATLGSRVFGTEVKPEAVIGETLRRITGAPTLDAPDFIARLRARIQGGETAMPASFEDFAADPLSAWIETVLGVSELSPGVLTRSRPRTLGTPPASAIGPEQTPGAAAELAASTGLPEEVCLAAIKAQLLAGNSIIDPATRQPVFAFKLHQFIRRGETVYASLEPESIRYVTLQAQKFVPGDRERSLYPLVFCRECGQEYYQVSVVGESGTRHFRPPAPDPDSDEVSGYLYVSESLPWPTDPVEVRARIPADWIDHAGDIRRYNRDFLPRPVLVDGLGREASGGATQAHFVGEPFRFCLACGVSHSARLQEFAKLATLGVGGRSSATTVLSFSAVRWLKEDPQVSPEARKLLCFSDNRQDVSLQAGHFNDFVQVSLLRSGLYRAVAAAGSGGLAHDELTLRVFEALDLSVADYAQEPEARFAAKNETDRALREVLGYRLFLDLRRGWRITSPNLEQAGLLRFDYLSLDELCGSEDVWADKHEVLRDAAPQNREAVCRTLLDLLRRELAIKADYLDATYQERIRNLSNQRLRNRWAIDDAETFVYASMMLPRSTRQGDRREWSYVSARSAYGRYLRRADTFPGRSAQPSSDDTGTMIADLFRALQTGGQVAVVREAEDDEDCPGYQLLAGALRWIPGDGTEAVRDPLRTPTAASHGSRPNPFFIDLYQKMAWLGRGLEAGEHTAQVLYPVREEREQRFRTADLPVLYCSPTMELGVDISDLSVVAMRNVPPTPANYAQRSGRAGRSGRPALVVTYCTTGSAHDQYFFRRPELMVAGQVSPPRIDLANVDLVRAHVQAIWLAEASMDLGRSLKDVLDVAGDDPSLRLNESVVAHLRDPLIRKRALKRAAGVLDRVQADLAGAPWWSPSWLEETLGSIEQRFELACERWRGLYRAARRQYEFNSKVMVDAMRPTEDKARARRLREEAEAQINLLTAEGTGRREGDFYSYRYFASEGFLPGYSFPRLPLSAFIPGRRGVARSEEYLSRPRFLAISEFGPRNILYHEGSTYEINKVMLPVVESENADAALPLQSIKRCGNCGYLHPMDGAVGADVCERCGATLGIAMKSLFRLQNVSTRRRERISSDEEERRRVGYEIRTGVRFAEVRGRLAVQTATADVDGDVVAKVTYGHSATIWRLNMGWRRRRPGEDGFVLDSETGRWLRREALSSANDADDAPAEDGEPGLSGTAVRVIPYVEDHRNCLLFEPSADLDSRQIATLQWALAAAIQAVYQLEDNELAAEPLPTPEERSIVLLFEAAEGGAGVLRRVAEDAEALRAVARAALDICHFDPESGEDLHRAPGAREDCEAACYDCLMSYRNQRDHDLLDRTAVRDYLLRLTRATVTPAPGEASRADHLEALGSRTDSGLEREWLELLDSHAGRLPDQANVVVKDGHSKPDFLYDQGVAVYIDGPPHDYPDRQLRDGQHTAAMEGLGYTVLRFTTKNDWLAKLREHPWVFGVDGG